MLLFVFSVGHVEKFQSLYCSPYLQGASTDFELRPPEVVKNDEEQGSDGWAIPSVLALALALSDPFPMLPPPAIDTIIARIICSQTGDLRVLRVPL